MALLGKGALANWHDVPDDAHADFNAWHTHEHIPERVGVPGFLRGRRVIQISIEMYASGLSRPEKQDVGRGEEVVAQRSRSKTLLRLASSFLGTNKQMRSRTSTCVLINFISVGYILNPYGELLLCFLQLAAWGCGVFIQA